MSREAMEPMNKVVAALKTGTGLKDDFIYYMSFDDYKIFPDPFPRTPVHCREVARNHLPLSESGKTPGELFRGIFMAAVHAGESIYAGHGCGHDSRRGGQRI